MGDEVRISFQRARRRVSPVAVALAVSLGLSWSAAASLGGEAPRELKHAARGSAAGPQINDWCPVMTEEKADPAITTVYEGRAIAFCCDRCLSKFLANPQKYAAKLPQLGALAGTAAPASLDDPLDHATGEDPALALGAWISGAVPGEHEHAGAGESPGDARVPLLGRIHPVIVHFPLAGLPLALLGFLVWMAGGREKFARADVPPLLVATVAAVAAVCTGNIAHDAMRFSNTLHRVVEQHQFISTVVMVLAVCLSVIRIWRWNRLVGVWRWTYVGGLFVACALLGVTGYLGGSLVFGPGHLRW